MTHTTTTAATPSTPTEQQLFSRFADGEAIVRSRTGKVRRRVPVADLFSGWGETDDFTDVMPDVLDRLRREEEPALCLLDVLWTLKGIVADVELAIHAFDGLLSSNEEEAA